MKRSLKIGLCVGMLVISSLFLSGYTGKNMEDTEIKKWDYYRANLKEAREKAKWCIEKSGIAKSKNKNERNVLTKNTSKDFIFNPPMNRVGTVMINLVKEEYKYSIPLFLSDENFKEVYKVGKIDYENCKRAVDLYFTEKAIASGAFKKSALDEKPILD